MEHPTIFNSVEDECRYWKERAKLYHKEWTDAKQEFDEFFEDSRQLEAEMEKTLDQKEIVIRDLRKQVVQLEKENESLRIKSDSHGIEFNNIEKQLATSQHEKEAMKLYLRQLEQTNDDLERKHRILVESISDFEGMLDKAYEKNALLEIEVDEKEMLHERIQRLMDETRDLKQELTVKCRPTLLNNMNGVIENNINSIEISTPATQATNNTLLANDYGQSSLKNPENMLNGNAAMTASSRTTALNIVGDMLRKLNLDKALLCSRCDKFRCICERPLSSSSMSTASSSTTTSSTAINKNTNTTSSNLFGTNIFQRFSQKLSGITTSDNAMESKLKTYREQVPPAPRQ